MICDSEFVKIAFKNAVGFLDEAVGFVNLGFKQRKNLILAIVNIQFTIELSLKSFIVKYFGIRAILIDKQAQMPDIEIDKLFNENGLKVREFDALKNFTKSNKSQIKSYDFDKIHYKYLEQFQNLRNKILHSSYVFSEEEILETENNMIYALVHIIGQGNRIRNVAE